MKVILVLTTSIALRSMNRPNVFSVLPHLDVVQKRGNDPGKRGGVDTFSPAARQSVRWEALRLKNGLPRIALWNRIINNREHENSPVDLLAVADHDPLDADTADVGRAAEAAQGAAGDGGLLPRLRHPKRSHRKRA